MSSSNRVAKVTALPPVVIEETHTGYKLKGAHGREVIIEDTDALRVWLDFGLHIDRKFEGQLDAATGGGLGALRRHYLERKNAKAGH